MCYDEYYYATEFEIRKTQLKPRSTLLVLNYSVLNLNHSIDLNIVGISGDANNFYSWNRNFFQPT